MNTVPYDDMKFYYITNHYDLHLTGYCWYNGKLAEFETEWEDPADAICHIIELPWYKRIWARLYVHVYLRLWFLYGWGRNGHYYWKRWYYE